MRSILLLAAALPLYAGDDVRAVLEHMIQAEKQNEQSAMQYTFREETNWYNYDKQGKARWSRSETHEVIFVEGIQYRKLIARNSKPLSAKEAAEVEKEMRETAEERRRHPPAPEGGRLGFGRSHVDVGSLSELLTLFDNRLVGEETVGGRTALVVESRPMAGHPVASLHEKDVLSFNRKLWIDQQENVLLRMVITVGPNGLFAHDDELLASAGSTMTVESSKINEQVWEPVLLILDFQRPSGKTIRPVGRTEYRSSQFQKFNVESTITVEPPK